MTSLWFNEDGDMVFGYKNDFLSKEQFKDEANKLHIKQTGYGCIVDDVHSEVYLITDKSLSAEMMYKLKDTGVEIVTMYYASIESIEELLEEGKDILETKDGIFIDKFGKPVTTL